MGNSSPQTDISNPSNSSSKRKSSITSTTTPSKRAKAVSTTSLLASANSLNEAAFSSKYLPAGLAITAKNGTIYPLILRTSSNLTTTEFNSCFSLLEETSSSDYKNATQGWHPRSKRLEMREKDMRYLLLTSPQAGSPAGTKELLAFTSFMLTSEDDIPVIYIYEIHLRSELRGTGVGKAFMKLVENVGRRVGMQRCMLTVFTANEGAERFYRALAYTEDDISPRERRLRGGKVKRPEYLILSKPLGTEEERAA